MTKTIKAAAVAQEVAANSVTVVTAVAETKASKARDIFATMFNQSPVPARKDMIAAAVAGAGLTTKGAATYLQNFKNKTGRTQHRAAAPAVATA